MANLFKNIAELESTFNLTDYTNKIGDGFDYHRHEAIKHLVKIALPNIDVTEFDIAIYDTFPLLKSMLRDKGYDIQNIVVEHIPMTQFIVLFQETTPVCGYEVSIEHQIGLPIKVKSKFHNNEKVWS